MEALYFMMALESAPLTWLEILKPNSMHSWEDLKKVFVDNFHLTKFRRVNCITALVLSCNCTFALIFLTLHVCSYFLNLKVPLAPVL